MNVFAEKAKCYFSASRLLRIKVNRVRVMRRGWDALNKNFSSPVQFSPRIYGLYWFSKKKRVFALLTRAKLLDCEDLWTAIGDVNCVFKLANVSPVHTP